MEKFYSQEEMQNLDFSKCSKEEFFEIARDTKLSIGWLLEDGGWQFLQEHTNEYSKIKDLLEEIKKYKSGLTKAEQEMIDALSLTYTNISKAS